MKTLRLWKPGETAGVEKDDLLVPARSVHTAPMGAPPAGIALYVRNRAWRTATINVRHPGGHNRIRVSGKHTFLIGPVGVHEDGTPDPLVEFTWTRARGLDVATITP